MLRLFPRLFRYDDIHLLLGSAASPVLSTITPRGGQRGTETTISLNGARLSDAKEIFVYYPGISVAKLQVVNDNQVKATIKIAADCRLGEHAMRIRTATGISELQTFYVGAFGCVEHRVLVDCKIKPIRAPILHCRGERGHKLPAGVVLMEQSVATRVSYVEVPGLIE